MMRKEFGEGNRNGLEGLQATYLYMYVSMYYIFIPCSDQVTCRNFSVKQNYCGLFFRAAIRTPINMCKLTGLMPCVARFSRH